MINHQDLKPLCFKFKSISHNDYTLKSQRIDIWQYPLQANWNDAALFLNSEELERANRFYFERHRRRFTIAHAMLRLILTRYLPKTHPIGFSFGENKYGKPHLLNGSGLQFNLSHSEELALLVIGKDHPVGIDLEFFSGRPYAGIGEQLFSQAENSAFAQTKPCQQALSFFHIWSQKEAFIKACGMGLSYPTQQFSVPHLPPTNQLILDSLNHQSWQMVSFVPQIACAAAVCFHPEVQEIRYKKLEGPDDFIK